MRRRYSSYSMLFAIGLVLTNGCSLPACHKDKSGLQVATGEIRQANASGQEIWVDELLIGGRNHRAGVLIPSAFKHMGFAQIAIGGEIKLVYSTYVDGKETPSQTLYFDSVQLRDVADKVKYMKFIFTADHKWILQVYDRSETGEGYEEGQYLKELSSRGAGSDRASRK